MNSFKVPSSEFLSILLRKTNVITSAESQRILNFPTRSLLTNNIRPVMFQPKQANSIFSISGYLLSVLLVLLYVQMYPVWKILNTVLNEKVLFTLPVAGTVLFLVIVLFFSWYRKKRAIASNHILFVVAGIALCCGALAVPDPGVPVKRIHVAEYMLLSLVVRFAMSYRLQGYYLLFFSACFTALLGVHDEFLQGLHPSRTYGLRDISVNALGSFGGALLWHGCGFFNRANPPLSRCRSSNKATSLIYIAWLLASVLALVWPIAFYRTAYQPYWTAMPILGAVVFFSMYWNSFDRGLRHGILAISAVSFPMICYPVITNISSFLFY